MKLLALVAAVALATGVSAQTKVLICGSVANQPYISDVQAKLTATGFFTAVDMFNTYDSLPSMAQLTPYDAILVFTDWDPVDTNILGDSLAAYINGGGGVVNCVFSTGSVPIGGDFAQPAYQVILPLGQESGTMYSLGQLLEPCHPIVHGITNFNGGSSSYRSTSDSLAAGGQIIATWNDGAWLVATKENVGPANARRADLNFYPPSSDARSDFWDASTQGDTLMAYALLWVAGVTNGYSVSISLPMSSVCLSDAVTLSGGSPAGGTWSGTGVSGTTFDPQVAGVGTTQINYIYTDTSGCSDTASATLTVNACAGIDEATNTATMSVYPNPANTFCTIVFTAAAEQLELADLQGKAVYRENLTGASNGFTKQLDLSTLSDGVYFLKVKSGETMEVQKIFVQH